MTGKELEQRRKTHKLVQCSHKVGEYCGLEGLKEAIEKLEKAIPVEAIDPEKGFSLERIYGYYDSVDVELNFWAEYWLPKTAEEIAQELTKKRETSRIAREAAKTRKLKQEEAERKEFERLKAKFGAS